jgi:hypothetical protein
MQDIEKVPVISFRLRYWVCDLDFFVGCGLVFYILGAIFRINSTSQNLTILSFTILMVSYFGYFSLTAYYLGSTPAQYLFKLKTVDQTTLSKPTIRRLFFRELLFITAYTGIGSIFYLAKGAYWDRATHIIVIKKTS